jgi:Helix-turn-helix domain
MSNKDLRLRQETVHRQSKAEPRMNQGVVATNVGVLTVGEVAAFFRCDPETVKRQARRGRLPGFKFGKFWYFRQQDIDNMIDTELASAREEKR